MDGMRAPIDSQVTGPINGGLQRGWLFINIGILLTMWGVSWLLWGIYSFFDTPAEFTWDKMMMPAILLGQSGVLFGLLVLIFGMRAIKTSLGSTGTQMQNVSREVTNIRKRGWLISITGCLFTFWGVLFMVLTIYNLVILRGSPDATTDISQQVWCFLPGLIVGVPLLLSGSRKIIFAA